MVPLENSSGDSGKNKLYPKRAKQDSASVSIKPDQFLNSLISSVSWSPEWIQEPHAWVGHMPFAYWLMAECQPRIFVELGTHTGNSYFSFCQAVREKGLNTRCYAVDTWQGDEQAGFYGGDVFERVNQHNESQYKSFSTLYRMTFDEAVVRFQDRSVDLLHIDGLHTYEAVRHDFETWFPKLAPGALVLFHDIKVTHGEFGVWKFWHELREKYPKNMEFRHSHGLGVIRVPGGSKEKKPTWLDEGAKEQRELLEVISSAGESLITKAKGQQLERFVASLQSKGSKADSEKPLNLELFFAREGEAFSEEKKISEPLLCRDKQPAKTRISLQGKAARSVLWRIDPGCQAGRILIRSLKFFSEDSKVVWDLQDNREQVAVGGTATALPYPAVGIELVSTGDDPQLILHKLPSQVLPVALLQIELEIKPPAEAIHALAKFYAKKEGYQRAVMTQTEGRVKKLEESLEAKKQEAQANSFTREAVEKSFGELKSELAKQSKVQQEANLFDQTLFKGLIAELKDKREKEAERGQELRQELEAQKVATTNGAKELGDCLAGLRQELEAQKVATANGAKELGDSLAGLRQELIDEIRELAGKMHERQDHLQQKNLAEIEILRATSESRMSKNENDLQDVATYAEQIQDSVIAPSSYMIPAPFSWYAYLYKMLKIRKPGLINKTPTANSSPPRPGFWRRLERSIRKRRKRWIAGIGFDRDWYLEFYPDVAEAGLDPLSHFIEFGQKEGRHRNAKQQAAHDKASAASLAHWQKNLTPLPDILKQEKIFDENFYLEKYPDVKKAKMKPWDHFVRHGHNEGRLPHKIDYSLKPSEVSLSVVIPTYNGQQKISRTIEAISRFSHGMDIEIIIVNDGSSDQTESVVQALSSKVKNINLISTKQSGAGNARNTGAKVASKEILLFMGDDISPIGPQFFNVHAVLHKINPQINYSVLGKVEWPDDSYFPISPVMEHIQGSGGEQFGYSDMRPNMFWDWRFFYTCNVSVKRQVVSDWEAEGFEPSFAGCGFEDGEFAYRMSKKYGSFNIFYSDQSVGWHYHRHTFMTFFQRQAFCGSQVTNLIELHPESAGKTGVEEVLEILNKNNSNNPELAYKTLESIRQINRLTLDLEARGLLGNDKWHKELLHVNFRLGYILGFLNSSAKPHQSYAQALTYVFDEAVRPLVPHLPTSFLRP